MTWYDEAGVCLNPGDEVAPVMIWHCGDGTSKPEVRPWLGRRIKDYFIPPGDPVGALLSGVCCGTFATYVIGIACVVVRLT